jgi:hypothetical protein
MLSGNIIGFHLSSYCPIRVQADSGFMLLNKQCPREHCGVYSQKNGYELGCFLMRMYCHGGCRLDDNRYVAWR